MVTRREKKCEKGREAVDGDGILFTYEQTKTMIIYTAL